MNRSLAAAGLCYCLVIGLAAGLAAAEPASAGPASSTAELPLIFDEDMSSLPNERFQSLGPGGADWKRDSHWTIKAPAVFARQAKTGRDAHLAIRMDFPRLKE